MGKLIKYELKAEYKKYFILFGADIIINFCLLAKISIDEAPVKLLFSELFVLIFTNLIVLIAILIFAESSFKRDLEQDTGYLTFTLPVKAYSIIGSKLIAVFMGYIFSAAIFDIFAVILINLAKVLPQININSNIILDYIPSQISQMFFYAMFILGIYFAIAITKSVIKNKKVNGFLTFIVFMAGLILVQYINNKIMTVFPQTIFNNCNSAASEMFYKMLDNSIGVVNSGINIASFIYSIVLFIALFFGTSYLLENKVNI